MTLPHITKKQQEILLLISQFRFLNRLQIQQFLHHKDHRLINIWLKDLVEKQYLTRIYSTQFGENTKPAVFYTGVNSIRYLKTIDSYSSDYIRKLYRDKDRSQTFIKQSILLADACLTLRDQSKDGISFEFTTECDYTDADSQLHFLYELHPHLIFSKQKTSAKKYYIVEVIAQKLHTRSLNKRIRAYMDFFFSNLWENNMKKLFPVLLFICANKVHMIQCKRMTKRLLEQCEPEKLPIRFSTCDEVKKDGITGKIWEEVEYK